MTHPKIETYDATLRDGMQGEGMSLTAAEKVRVVRKLDELGVDLIEAGFPASNPKELELFGLLEKEELRARADRRVRDDAPARRRRRRRPVAADPRPVLRAGLHDRRQDLEAAPGEGRPGHARGEPRADRRLASPTWSAPASAWSTTPSTSSTPTARTRSTASRACAPRRARAPSASCCATPTGRRCRTRSPAPCASVRAQLGEEVALGIHCHNDLECGVANTLAAVAEGATQVQGTMNGIGERTGNANLVTVIANLELRLGPRAARPRADGEADRDRALRRRAAQPQPGPARGVGGAQRLRPQGRPARRGRPRRRVDLRALRPGRRRQRARAAGVRAGGPAHRVGEGRRRRAVARRRGGRARDRARQGAGAPRLPVRGGRRLVRAAAAPARPASTSRCSAWSPGA